MRRSQGTADLPQKARSALELHRSLFEERPQSDAVNQFHDQIRTIRSRLACMPDLHHPGIVQRLQRGHLLHKTAAAPFFVVAERVQQFHGHGFIAIRPIERAIDSGESAGGDALL